MSNLVRAKSVFYVDSFAFMELELEVAHGWIPGDMVKMVVGTRECHMKIFDVIGPRQNMIVFLWTLSQKHSASEIGLYLF